MKFSVSRNDSSDLGFAILCRLSGTISHAEFIQWVYWVIEKSTDELPHFFFELDELEESAINFHRALGFSPSTGLTPDEEDAVDGIAYLRNATKGVGYDAHITRADAVAALGRNLQVVNRFNAVFPFIDWSMPSSPCPPPSSSS